MRLLSLLPSRLGLVAAAAVIAAGSYVGQACFMRSPQPVQVWMDHIEVDIENQVAVKRYKCVFLNPNARPVVGGVCYMEVEPGAQVDEMSLQIGDKVVKGEVLDLEKANKVFTDIVRNGGSPALLEYYGNKLIRTRVPKIPPRGTVTVHLQYTTVVKSKDDLVRVQVLNTNPKAKLQPLKAASVTVSIKSDAAVLNVYSPTHDIKVKEGVGEDALKVSWSQEQYLPKTPFILYYATSKKNKIGVNTLAHREEAEKGYFMTMIAPTLATGKSEAKLTDADIQPKDVVFCVDTSYSMNANGKMEQARKALAYCVKNLRAGDRFNIVDFSTEARQFKRSLVEVDDKSRQQALNYIKDLEASGGTAIHEALANSLEQFTDGKRLKMIMFMTDGLPTIGEREPKKILADIGGKNAKDVRMFVFGAGYDVNTRMLDALASDNRGDSDYIMPKEDIAKRIASFFDKVGSPIMTDLEIEIEGIKRADIYPRQLPDLFKGDQVIVYGRYELEGERKATLRGLVNGEPKELSYTISFPKVSERNSFVPRLWAGQKVSSLLTALRKKGESQELIDEVVMLSKRYGIVTPYTAFLVNDETMRDPRGGAGAGNWKGGRKRLQDALKKEAEQAGEAKPAAPDARENMAKDADDFAEVRRAASKGKLNRFDGQNAGSIAGGSVQMKRMRYVGSKTYYNAGGIWYDSRFDPDKDKPTKVAIGSDAYMALIADNRGVSKILALGQVVLKVKSGWVQITPRAKK